MGVHCSTYRLNAEKICTNLVSALTDTTIQPCFSEYLKAEKEQISKFNYYNNKFGGSLELDKILLALTTADAYVNSAYLGVILNWLNNLSESPDFARSDDLSFYGFDEIYSPEGRAKCWVYANQIDAYVRWNNLEEPDFFEDYTLLSNEFYKAYLLYLLTVLKAVYLDIEYADNPSTQYPDSFIRDLELPNDYQKQAQSALIEIRKENQREDLAKIADPNYRRSSTAYHYRVASDLIYDILDVQKIIEGHPGKILIEYSV